MNAREAAFLSLLKYENHGVYSNIELSYSIERNHLEGAEKALYTALFYGVIERKLTLDYYIAALSDRPEREIDINIRVILRIGLYQLLYMNKIPESAAVNESVKLAGRFYAKKNSESFINAVLRSFLRRKHELSFPDRTKDPIKALSVLYSVPEWICRLWRDTYGTETAEKILNTLNVPPAMTLTVNPLKNTPSEFLSFLAASGIDAVQSELSPSSVRLAGALPLNRLSPFEGRYFVQDEASALCVLAMGAQPGETVLDACACPGGKSFGMAMAMQNTGRICSFDLHKNKLSLIEKGAASLGISIIETGVQNAAAFREDMPRFDRVLCDVPCSGLGVLAKKPDIRYKSEDDVQKLPELQYRILKTGAEYLKTGGTLVYSTCTLNPAENHDVVNRFLDGHPDFSLCPFEAGALHSDGMLEILPHEYGTDGFFIAKLAKKD
ncbi:MAG: 16S rRNA (cytosine(967)-C(5))-methyltransferase RsmB [Clostridiales bacterium]|nr:16S rRNA (cytosine(967)-C(5))-methyltransferase RsmB [Clostridiales bacterium]